MRCWVEVKLKMQECALCERCRVGAVWNVCPSRVPDTGTWGENYMNRVWDGFVGITKRKHPPSWIKRYGDWNINIHPQANGYVEVICSKMRRQHDIQDHRPFSAHGDNERIAIENAKLAIGKIQKEPP